MKRVVHCCIDVRGLLKSARFPSDYVGMCKHDDGRPMSPDEARDALFDQLAQGREVIPFGPACEGFDYTTGCPGHEQKPTAQIAPGSTIAPSDAPT